MPINDDIRYPRYTPKATPSSPATATTTPAAKPAAQPKVTYTPGGAQRQPGFYNPANPYDTGRAGETNRNVNAPDGGLWGGKVADWDYDAGRPKNPNATVGDDGFYQSGGGGGGGGGSVYSLDTDPAVQELRALSQRTRQSAKATHTAKRKQAAITYGDASGLGLDADTERAAAGNEFSTVRRLKRDYDEGILNLEDALNKDNLFYSGERGTQLSRAATSYQGARQDAADRFRGYLTDLDDALNQALLNADYMDINALMGAYGRSVGQALDSGVDPGDTTDDPVGDALTPTRPRKPKKPRRVKLKTPESVRARRNI